MATTEPTEQPTQPEVPTRDDVWKFAAKLSDEDLDAFLKEASVGQAIAEDMGKNGRAWLDAKHQMVVPTDKHEKDEKDEKDEKKPDEKPDEKPDDAKPDEAEKDEPPPPSRTGVTGPPSLKRSCSVMGVTVVADEAAAKAAKTEEPPTPRPVSSMA